MSANSPIILFFIGLLSLQACTSSEDGVETGIEIGMKAPSIVSTDIHGDHFELASLEGSYVLIDFWGSWCGPCIREAPELVALHDEFGAKGLEFLSIAIEKNDKNWKKAAEKLGYDWHNQLVEVSTFVRFNKIASDYNVSEIPSVFLLDPDGKIIASKSSVSDVHNMLEKLFP